MALLAALTCLGFALALIPFPQTVESLAYSYVLIFLFLELSAVSISKAGRFRSNAGILCAASTSALVGPWVTAPTLLIGTFLQTWRKGEGVTAAALGRDLVPCALAVLLATLWPSWQGAVLAVLGYLGGQRLVERELLSSCPPADRIPLIKLLELLRPLEATCTVSGLLWLHFGPEDWAASLALAPLLWCSHWAAENMIYRVGMRTASETVHVLSGQRDQMKGKLELLGLLLQACRELAGELDEDSVNRRLERVLRRSIPHQAGALLEFRDGSPALSHHWSPAQVKPRISALQSLAQEVWTQQDALEVDDGSQSHYPAPFDKVRSMLAFPLKKGREVVAVVVLADSKPANFDLQDKRLLAVLATQAGTTLDNARLYGDVLQGQERLKESQAQLFQSEKMTALGQLAAGVAHELNTPLGAVLLAIEDAQDRMVAEPESAGRLLDSAIEALLQSQSIIEGLLEYSRADDRRENISVRQLLTGFATMLEPKLARQQVKLEIVAGAELTVSANPNHVRQILTNLVLNAVDASQPPCRVQLSLYEERAWAVVEVRDWGTGMSPAVVSRIFDPFFTSKPVGKGTGLGLTVSRQLAQRYGGELSCQSEPGKGSVFRLKLPSLTGSPEA